MTARGARGKAKGHQRTLEPASSRGARYIFLLIGLLGSLHVLIMIGVEMGRYLENSQEIARLRGDIAEIESEMRSLELILEHANDERYREALARRQGFVFPDEQRFFTLTPED